MNAHEPPDISVVAPVYNEQETLEAFIERTVAACSALDRSWELVLVDDGSRDRSRELIAAAAGNDPRHIVGILLNRNYGQHAAVLAGLQHARGSIVVTLDADLQNPPEEIATLVAKMDEGYDVVGSVRQDRRDSVYRRLFSWVINATVRRVTGVDMHDYGCMLRAYRRPIIDAMLQCPERSTFIPVLANSFARRTAEVQVRHAERAEGSSRYGPWKLVNLQFDLLTSMTTFPLRLLSIAGVVICAVGVGFGGLLGVLRIIHGPEWAAEGVFTLFAILFVFIGAQFIAMGLLGEYIGRIYHDVRARPRYFVSEVVGGAGRHRAAAIETPAPKAAVEVRAPEPFLSGRAAGDHR